MLRLFGHLAITQSLLVSMVCSCVEVVNIDTSGADRSIAIYGQINDSQRHDQRVRVSWTTADYQRPEDIPDAQVMVTNLDGQCHSYSFSKATGYYHPDMPFVGVPGQSYQLQVQVGSVIYASPFERMPLFTAKDSSYFDILQKEVNAESGADLTEWTLQLLTDSTIPAAADTLYIRRDVLQAYAHVEIYLPLNVFPLYAPKNCWITQAWIGPKILLFDGSQVPAKVINRQVVGETPIDNSFRDLRGYGVLQYSITKEALSYWQRIDQISNRVGSLFEIPPAAVPGNIRSTNDHSDYALGYFEVAKVDTTGVVVLAENIPIFLGFNGNFVQCDNVSFQEMQQLPLNCYECLEDLGVERACFDCLVLQNSSTEKPAFLQ